MPRNWDPSQTLNNGQVEWPQGPLTTDTGQTFPTVGWTPRWVDAWVVQARNGGISRPGQINVGASQATYQKGSWVPGRWTAAGIPPGWKSGTFRRGLATGIALVAFKKGTADAYEWWVDAINLR